MNNLILIALGGAVGSLGRYGCQKLIYQLSPHAFPVGTLAVNVAGCFLAGVLFGLSVKNSFFRPEWGALLITGFCGGFTTFSTFSLETLSLFRDGEIVYGMTYIIASLVGSLVAVWGGFSIIKAFYQ